MKVKMDLKLFDAGDGAGSGASGTDGAAGGNGTDNMVSAGMQDVAKSNETVEVETGTATAEEGQNAAGIKMTSDEQRKADFENLIKGEYKDLYDDRVQSIVKARIKENKGLQSQLDSFFPLINLLASKYGVENADPQKIMQAVEADNSFFEEAAMKEGLTVEQYKHLKKMEAENRELKEAERRARNARQRDQMWARWNREASEVKNFYPGFNLQTELSNPEFVQLLGSGVGVKAAYQAIHMDEIMSGTIAQTAKIAAKRQVDAIKAGQARPLENGAAGAAGMNAKIDVSKLTDKQIDELAKRARMGETISF